MGCGGKGTGEMKDGWRIKGERRNKTTGHTTTVAQNLNTSRFLSPATQKNSNNLNPPPLSPAYNQQMQPQQSMPPAPPQNTSAAPSTRVFVGNLPWNCTWRNLKDHFKGLSFNPTHADVLIGGDGRSKVRKKRSEATTITRSSFKNILN